MGCGPISQKERLKLISPIQVADTTCEYRLLEGAHESFCFPISLWPPWSDAVMLEPELTGELCKTLTLKWSDRRLGEVLCNCWELKAIGPGSAKEATLDHMLEFLDSWEDHSKGLGFLSKHISVGLCVTLRTTKDLLRYLTEKAGFNYFMASHLSQDCLERSFGIVRQAGCANDHFTPA
nr:uncharacterized protein LOC129383657 isoform X1 [Dermacentor andersoni]